MLIDKEELAKRNAAIYEAYREGARHKAQGTIHGLSEKRIKEIVGEERKRRGLKKEIGRRQ
jgi:hypothetical protein